MIVGDLMEPCFPLPPSSVQFRKTQNPVKYFLYRNVSNRCASSASPNSNAWSVDTLHFTLVMLFGQSGQPSCLYRAYSSSVCIVRDLPFFCCCLVVRFVPPSSKRQRGNGAKREIVHVLLYEPILSEVLFPALEM